MNGRITQVAVCCGSHYHRWTTPGDAFPNGHVACAHCQRPLRWHYHRSSHSLNYERIIARAAAIPEPFSVTDLQPAVPFLARNDLCSFCNNQSVRGLFKRVATGDRNKTAALYVRGPKFPILIKTETSAPQSAIPRSRRLSPYEIAWRAFRAGIVVPERPD